MSANTPPISVGKALETLKFMGEKMWRMPVMMWGAPGIGKTTIAEAAAEWLASEHKKKTGIDISGKNFHDIRLTTIEAVDLRGLPYFDHDLKQSVFYPPAMLPHEDMPGIIFLDEITATDDRSLMAAAYSLLQERRIGAYKVPDNWLIVAAGNGAEHGAISHEMGTALADRFVHLNIVANPDNWLDFMSNAGGHPLVMTYIKKHGDKLECCENRVQQGKLIDASPRGWERVSKALHNLDAYKQNDRDILEIIIPGIVGEARAADFFNEIDSLKDTVDARKLLEAKDKDLMDLMPKTVGGLWNLVFSIPPLADDKKKVARAYEVLMAIRKVEPEDNSPVAEISTFGVDLFFTKVLDRNKQAEIDALINHPLYAEYRAERASQGLESAAA